MVIRDYFQTCSLSCILIIGRGISESLGLTSICIFLKEKLRLLLGAVILRFREDILRTFLSPSIWSIIVFVICQSIRKVVVLVGNKELERKSIGKK